MLINHSLVVVVKFVHFFDGFRTSHELQKIEAIDYEDSKLENIFGDEWREWSKNIRAIIPGRARWSDLKTNGWDTRQSLIRNGELPISLYLLSCGIWLWVVSHAHQ